MKLKVGFLYEVRAGEYIAVIKPGGNPTTRLSSLCGGDLFMVLYGPKVDFLNVGKSNQREFHTYIVLHNAEMLVIQQYWADVLQYVVGFHTP